MLYMNQSDPLYELKIRYANQWPFFALTKGKKGYYKKYLVTSDPSTSEDLYQVLSFLRYVHLTKVHHIYLLVRFSSNGLEIID